MNIHEYQLIAFVVIQVGNSLLNAFSLTSNFNIGANS